jgi:hypothetical protein
MKIEPATWNLGDGIVLNDAKNLGAYCDATGHGAYKDYVVSPGMNCPFECLHNQDAGTLTIEFYDQTNLASIQTADKTDTSWATYTTSVDAPAGCTTIRVKFLQKDSTSAQILIDNVEFITNTITDEPDRYNRTPQRVGHMHTTLSGRRVFDLRSIHYRIRMGWNVCSEAQYGALEGLYYSDQVLYFDDGDVPPVSESEVVYENATYNYVGITNPSSTHIAYSDNGSALPSAEGDYETTEFSTAEYQAIDVDDSNYEETTNPTAGNYLYHKLTFLSGIATADVQRFRVKVVGLSDDESPYDLDGCVLYAWNGTHWVELTRTTSSAKTDLTYTTATASVAQQYVDSVDSYVRLLLRSRGTRDGTNNLNLRTYFAECEINEDLDLVIDTSHKMILTDGDVIWCKNVTTGETLVLTTDYTIASDRRSVTVSGQSNGDEIEVKYNRYFEVLFEAIIEEWLSGDPDDLDRGVEAVFKTLAGSE